MKTTVHPPRYVVTTVIEGECDAHDWRLETTQETRVRAYTVWPSKNTFCCYGHCMTGPSDDCAPNVCAWATTITPMVLFFYAWAEVLRRSSPIYLGLVVVSFSSTLFWFVVTAFSDPGIIARQLPPDVTPPLNRMVTLSSGKKVSEVWCTTCHIYRPEGASHCRDCDNCVRNFDHHCPFTRNCIGARNYASFVLYLLSVCLSLAVLLISCLVVLPGVLHGQGQEGETEGMQVNSALNFVLVTFSLVLSLFLWLFTGYHIALILSGLTTKEHLKGGHSIRRPMCYRASSCTCVGLAPSEIEPRKLVPLPVPIISWNRL